MRPQGLGSPQLTGQQNHAANKGEHSFQRKGQAQRPRPGKEQRVFEELKEGLCDRQVAVSSRRIIRTRFVFKNMHKKVSSGGDLGRGARRFMSTSRARDIDGRKEVLVERRTDRL